MSHYRPLASYQRTLAKRRLPFQSRAPTFNYGPTIDIVSKKRFMEKTSLVILIIAITGCSTAYTQKAAAPNRNQLSSDVLIDSVAKTLRRNYVYPERAKAIVDHLRSRSLKAKYRKISLPENLAAIIESDMQDVRADAHLRLGYHPEFAEELLRPRPEIPHVDSAAIKRDKLANFGFQKVEILNGNIGYIEFTSFNGNTDASRKTVAAAFQFLSNSSEIIIDLRRNGGGSPAGVQHIASFFFEAKTRLNDIYNRPRNDTTRYWANPEDGGNMKLKMPMYILTSRRTFSAAEDFTYAMQVNRRAIVVGDPTRGGAHPTISLPVGQGFVLDVPFARSINHITKTDWEGKGVRPDILTQGDDALATALSEILNNRKTQALTDDEKVRVQWLIDALGATDCDCNSDISIRKSHAGDYGRFKIHHRGNQLFLEDFTGRTFLLRPINPNHFLADDWLQVQFFIEDGISKLKLMGKPGWVDVYNKVGE